MSKIFPGWLRRRQLLKATSLLLTLFMVTNLGAPAALACTNPPAMNITTVHIHFVARLPSGAIVIFLWYDPWTTFGSTATQSCSAGFRLPDALVGSVDSAQLVETGTSTPIPGFSFVANATTTTDVEGLLASGAGDSWHGFNSNQTAAVTAGIQADFMIQVTLKPGVTLKSLQTTLEADLSNRVFSDESDAVGNPINTHQAFVSVSKVVPLPMLAPWGLALFILLLGVSGSLLLVIYRRRKAQSSEAAV